MGKTCQIANAPLEKMVVKLLKHTFNRTLPNEHRQVACPGAQRHIQRQCTEASEVPPVPGKLQHHNIDKQTYALNAMILKIAAAIATEFKYLQQISITPDRLETEN